MPLPYHPEIGTIVICDFYGFIEPEMVKRRPVIIVSPRFRNRDRLCTIVPCSTVEPNQKMDYHYRLELEIPLPEPYNSSFQWIKGDMVTTVSLDRLSLPFRGKDNNGKRIYDKRIVDDLDLKKIQICILNALNFSHLTNHL